MTATLVLDIGYQPVGVVSWFRALGMIHRGVAVPVERYDECVYTNEMDISVYDPERFGALGRFFDEELLAGDRVRVSMDKPAVIRVLSSVFRQKRVKFSRQNVYLRDGYQCQYAGCRTTARHRKRYGTDVLPATELTFDHVMPQSRGGRTEWLNIVACCRDCNSKKDNRTPQEARMQLVRPPREPKQLPIISSRMNTPDEWRNWLYWNVELER